MSAQTKPKVLIVLTSHDKLGNTDAATGWYLPEFAHPYEVLSPHVDFTIASPKGGHAPLDQGSVALTKDDAYSQDFANNKTHLWENTEKLENLLGRAKEFDAIFYVGGHGPMFDLANNTTSHQLIAEFYDAGKVISAVCHGPAAIVNAKLSNGEYLVKGQPVTGFSNVEEEQIQLTSVMPFLLEDDLKKNGAKYEKSENPWGPNISVGRGGKLLTGQNPASAKPLAEKVLEAITL